MNAEEQVERENNGLELTQKKTILWIGLTQSPESAYNLYHLQVWSNWMHLLTSRMSFYRSLHDSLNKLGHQNKSLLPKDIVKAISGKKSKQILNLIEDIVKAINRK